MILNYFLKTLEHGFNYLFEIHNDKELHAFILKSDADISTIDQCGWTPLHRAIEKDNIELVKLLIFKSNGADLNFTWRHETTYSIE